MSTFVIEEVLSQEEFSTEHGVFRAYEVRFSGDTAKGIATHKRKASSPPPTPGETIDAEIVRKGERTELKRVWQPNRPGAANGGGGQRFEDPRKAAEIRRMAAQKAAVHLLAVEVAAGMTFKEQKASDLLKPRIQFFEDDVREAGERA